MDSLAITDHGALYGIIDFYRIAKEEGVRPIIGCEVYVAPRSHRDRTPADRSPYHLTLLAKDNTGYKNLLQLVTRAHLDGFYYRPRVDRDLLQEHRQGLVALSGCLNGELSRLVLEDRQEEARSWARWAQEVFGGDVYLELQRHEGIPQLDTLNAGLFQLHRELGLPLAATNDFHYVSPEDAPLQDILICIHTNTTINDGKRLKMEGDSFYLKSPSEMAELFPDMPEALANTQRIAEECSVHLSFDQTHLPDYRPPDGQTPDAYLARLCREGLERRRPGAPNRYGERLDYELEVIAQTRFANYFLVVWDITAFARDQGILYGVRGSAAASLVLYCLGVTDVDPLEYGLVFERFLNVERKEMPDIDMDFQDDRRDEVIRHVVRTYGSDRVAQIITYGTMGPRAAIRDVGRAMAMPYPDVDRVARLVPFRARTMEEAIASEPELQQLQTDSTLRRLMDTAKQVEGMVRHVSTHAAGVVISGEPLTEYVPLQRPVRGGGGEDEISMTQFSMEPIAQLGLLKMDFLGLANLTILKRAIDRIAETRGLQLDLQTVPLDDAKTFEALSSGETADVFQLEGSGMRRHIKELKPASLAEVSAMIALYRPGPMEHIDTYIRAKHGEQARYPHASLEEVLEETYGVIVYQDQVLRIVQIVAGYSLGEADIVRKAMGKKIPAIMQQERARFIEGALAQGYAVGEAEAIFHLIEPFAGYAFNKAHAVSYALIAYWTAYFKANYPVEYMAAVLDIRMENQDKVAGSVAECHRLKIPVLPPDVNHSECHVRHRAALRRAARDPLRPGGGQERGHGRRGAPGAGAPGRRALPERGGPLSPRGDQGPQPAHPGEPHQGWGPGQPGRPSRGAPGGPGPHPQPGPAGGQAAADGPDHHVRPLRRDRRCPAAGFGAAGCRARPPAGEADMGAGAPGRRLLRQPLQRHRRLRRPVGCHHIRPGPGPGAGRASHRRRRAGGVGEPAPDPGGQALRLRHAGPSGWAPGGRGLARCLRGEPRPLGGGGPVAGRGTASGAGRPHIPGLQGGGALPRPIPGRRIVERRGRPRGEQRAPNGERRSSSREQRASNGERRSSSREQRPTSDERSSLSAASGRGPAQEDPAGAARDGRPAGRRRTAAGGPADPAGVSGVRPRSAGAARREPRRAHAGGPHNGVRLPGPAPGPRAASGP